MLAQNPDGGGDVTGVNNYILVGVQKVPRVNSDTTTETVVQITVKSKMYLVTFTWFMTLKTYNSDGYTAAAALKTSEVDQICGHEHVQGFRSEQDQDASNLLINNAVIDVGTDDGNILEPIRYRMDQIDRPGVFQAIDDAWAKLVKLGAS
jgi:hypothetical protein